MSEGDELARVLFQTARMAIRSRAQIPATGPQVMRVSLTTHTTSIDAHVLAQGACMLRGRAPYFD